MKIQKIFRKGRGIRAILCVMVGVLCIALGGMEAMAGYTNENHPQTVFSPDGTGWTIIDELPYMENPDCLDDRTSWRPCWTAAGTPIDTGIETSLPEPGVGQHIYHFDRTGYVPVDYWLVEWEKSKCIHGTFDTTYRGIVNLTNEKCWHAYWSGLIPYCADCGEKVNEALHYIKPSSAAGLQYIMVDEAKSYFYTCPYLDNHDGVQIEQGPEHYKHMCQEVSNNRYKVVYNRNAMMGAVGQMEPSFHMYDNATMLDGQEILPNKYLNLNRYVREGYTFAGWNTKPDGSGQSFIDGAEILNLTDEHYDIEMNPDPNHGVVTLYAQWERSVSHLKIDTKGGKYDDGVGVVNGDKTTYENRPYNSSITLKKEYLTPPMGYTVSFVTNCPTTIAPEQTQKVFGSWMDGTPFTGRLLNDVFYFIGGNDTWSVVEVAYDNGSIELPSCRNGDETLVGWYEDPELTIFVGVPGDMYTPSRDVVIYADWEKDLVLYAENDLTVDGGKGGVDLSWEAAGGLNKAFKIYQKMETENDSAWRQILDANNIGASLSVNETYNFTGTSKTYTVPYSGFYTLDAYGAQGKNYGSSKGGKGGYVTANVWLTAGDVLTITVGGQNGYNGGGSASQFANGGGYSMIKSRAKGVLLVAGGGGGAANGFDGGHGGMETSLVAGNVMAGASGMAGGGGGYHGGTAGTVIYHNHNTMGCTYHNHVGSSSTGGACYTTYSDQSVKCGNVQQVPDTDVCHTCYVDLMNQGRDPSEYEQYPGSYVVHVPIGSHDSGAWASHEWTRLYRHVCTTCGTSGLWNVSEHRITTRVYNLTCNLEWLCGKENGEIESSRGAYGGSSYVNSTAVNSSSKQAGVREGNGLIKISSNNVGYQVTFAMEDVSANDKAKPDAIDNSTVTKEDDGAGAVLLKWGRPEDNGTAYNHKAQSFNIVTGEHMCDSNVTTNIITTGVNRYYYYYGSSAVTVTASNKQGAISDVSGSGTARISLPSGGTKYFCVAPVDVAGNVGPTMVMEIESDEPVDWIPKTRQVTVSSTVGGRDYQNVYQKETGTYYVKADGYTPFKLAYDSTLSGSARADYQIDNLIFNVTSNASSSEQIYETIAERTSNAQSGVVSATITGRTASGEGSFLRDAMNSAVTRKRNAIDVSFYQSFKVPSSQNGKTLTVVPVAGVSYVAEDGFDEVKYSDWSLDINNAIKLIPDAEAPIIGGADVLSTMTEYDRDSGTVVTLSATDLLSGVRDFKVTVRNLDNANSRVFRPNAEGNIVINIDNSELLYYGAVKFEIEATDNVGNVNSISYGSDNLTLTADVNKTVPDGRTTFAQGEGAKLDILTTGYAERVEIVWPVEFGGIINSFNYTGNTEFARTECVPFIIPRGDKTEYEIIVRAYKNGMMKEETITLHIFGEMSGRVRIR